MDERFRVTGEGFGGGTASWSMDKKTWRYMRDTAGTPLRTGSTVIFILNPDYSDNFKDTEGNVLGETTFWFTIQGDRKVEVETFYNVVIHRFEANPAKGFHWPYYLSVPRDIQGSTVLMVGPNNSGRPAFDQAWHDYKAKSDLYWLTSFVWKLNVPVLVPTFPRPPDAYIQNLEGSAFRPDLPSDLQRIDLQLLAMIQEARETLQPYGIVIQDRVFMTGFSASGAFTSNFTVLHPEVVKASAAGGIGWRCAPLSSWDGIQQMSYTDQMTIDVQNFFRRHLSAQTACPSLGNGCTLSGESTNSQFYGGVKSDGGGSFRDRFSVWESIQILMTIGPDFNDVDWPGSIYVIGALNGICFCRHENGAWSLWNGTLEGLVKTYRREKLSAVEPLEVAAFPLNGLEGASFQFLVAYENSSGVIRLHWPPLSFTVTP